MTLNCPNKCVVSSKESSRSPQHVGALRINRGFMSRYLSKLKTAVQLSINVPDIDTKVLTVCFSRESKIWRFVGSKVHASNFNRVDFSW